MYSGQWGLPQFVASAIIGMISGALASIIESIGGYFAAARMVAAPPVPSDGVNRGILMEGVACLWAGLIGSGCGVTSYSGNIGALAITRNGSPRIMYAATLVLCIFGKFMSNVRVFERLFILPFLKDRLFSSFRKTIQFQVFARSFIFMLLKDRLFHIFKSFLKSVFERLFNFNFMKDRPFTSLCKTVYFQKHPL